MEDTNFKKLVSKIEEMKGGGKIDLSMDEDLSIAVMNLISLEEHFFFTAEKTSKPEYFDLMQEARAQRTALLKKLLPETEGEVWCISKHLLSTSMRLIEVGTKLHSAGKKDEAKEMFDRAYKIYSLFWAVRLGVVDTKDIKKINDDKKPWTVEDIVTKLVDCCKE